MPSSQPGAGWAITAVPACCIGARAKFPRATAANFRRLHPHCAICRASGDIPRPPLPALRLARPSPSSTGMWSACWLGLAAMNLSPAKTWEHAQALLSKSRPGDFNQAIMELGATVCLPRGARCVACPVRTLCATRARESAENGSGFAALQTAAPPRQIKREIWCDLDHRDGHVRLVKRPKKASLMAGMWELPQWTEMPHRCTQTLTNVRTLRHSITVTDYTVHVVQKDGVQKDDSTARGKWVAIKAIPALPITGLTRKILKAGGII